VDISTQQIGIAPGHERSGNEAVSNRPAQGCWNEIGVYGNGTCPELRGFIHCRNCPIYTRAGLQLLDRPLSPEYRQEWTLHFAREKKTAVPARISAVLFRVHNEWFALPTQAFQEVAERRHIHSLPHHRRGSVVGLTNIRGELVICVSLNRVLGIENTPAQASSRTFARMLVMTWDGQRLAFTVDEVQGIQRFEAHELTPAPATLAKSGLNFTQGVFLWQNRAVGFLDADLLFSSLNRNLK